jgi:hypothetical protein
MGIVVLSILIVPLILIGAVTDFFELCLVRLYQQRKSAEKKQSKLRFIN